VRHIKLTIQQAVARAKRVSAVARRWLNHLRTVIGDES